MLEVKGLKKRFGGLEVLRSLTFSVQQGEIVALLGPNGSGKTTTFSIISGFLAADGGSVTLEGHELLGAPPEVTCARGLCRTFQVVKPFGNLTVLQNVMVGAFARTGATAMARETALQVLDEIGLYARRDQLAHSLTIADRKALEVARALATRPRLLLLDEVMAGLNETELLSMMALIRRLRQRGITLLIVEHIMAAVMNLSDRVVILHQGEKIAEGPPAVVARDRRAIEAYLGEEYTLAQG